MTKTLDLGCGSSPRNPLKADEVYGLDIDSYGNPSIRVADIILEGIPYEDNYFDYVTAYDFLEHLPRIVYVNGQRKAPFIDTMSEIWRVLKPNGILKAHTPAFPYAAAFQDPTHVNFITEDTYRYFTHWADPTNGYGFKGKFELVNQRWDNDIPYHLVWEMTAVK